MDSKLVDLAENKTKLPNKVLLESLDGCARLRPVFDDIAKKYDAIITPSATDEAPVGTNTGDGVSLVCLLIMISSNCRSHSV